MAHTGPRAALAHQPHRCARPEVDVQALGGYLTVEDMAAVQPVSREPLRQDYGRHTIYGLPELTGGPTLALAFQHLTKNGGRAGTEPDGARFVAYAKALEFAWEDRFRRMGVERRPSND